MVLAGPGLARASGTGPASRRRRWALPAAVACGVLSLAGYLVLLVTHAGVMLNWYDLNVYNHAGLIARTQPARLYAWQLHPGIKFTYTPFASLVFALGSLLPWPALRWLMTVASVAAVAVTVWLTLGALGWRGRSRTTALLALAAVALWLEPVQRSLHLGQIEPVLMALIVWDLCQPEGRRWKGVGIGVAAGIKLVPLIFIPYLVLAGKLRQAAVVAGTFAGTVLLGFAVLPHVSAKYWLTGYFLHAGNVGDVGSLLNQSVYALVARAVGGVHAAAPIYLGVVAVIAVLGVCAAAVLDRRGRPVAGWLTCAVTGLLCSPISWDHHWVWAVPALVVLADAAVRGRADARWACWAVAAGVVLVYGDWPAHLAGQYAFVPQGLLGFFIGPHPELEKYHLRGLQVIGWNLFVLAGLALFALAVAAAAAMVIRAARPGPAPAEPERAGTR
jgi:alpha-1,2-mannosyltransferase